MPKVLLKIGLESILLPDDAGVATIIKALGRGVLASDRLYKEEIEIEGRALELSVTVVPAKTRFTAKERALTPEEQGFVRIKPKALRNGQKQLMGQLLLDGGHAQ